MNIRKLISTRLSRGRVDLNINLERTGETTYEVNRQLISGYVSALRDIQKEFNLSGDVDINTLTRLPGPWVRRAAVSTNQCRKESRKRLAKL